MSASGRFFTFRSASKCRQLIPTAALILAVVWLTAIAGCGGGSVGSGANLGTGPSSATIGPAGGSVASGTGSVNVPANAVSNFTTFTIGPATGYPADSRLLAGSAYTLDVGSSFLVQPITLTIQYSTLPTGAVVSSLQIFVVAGSSWRAVPGSTVNTTANTVSASIEAPGTYAIFITQTSSKPSTGTVLINRGAHAAQNSLAAMNIDSTGYHALLTSSAGQFSSTAHYSPSGSSIVFDYTDGVHGFYIYSMNSDGTGKLGLVGGGKKPDSTYSDNTMPAFSTDGATIAYVSDITGTPEVYTMTSAGANATQITTLADTAISSIFFTKAGNIAFYATVSGVSGWYLVTPAGTGLTSVNSSPINIALVSPWNSYSPDGTLIATGYLQGTTYDLYDFTTNGSVRTRLTNLSATAITNPHFTSDGLKIVFGAVVNGSSSVYIVNNDGTGLTSLTVSSGPDVMFDLH